MKVTVKWSRLGRAMLREWFEWICQSPGGSAERAQFEQAQLESELARHKGHPPGAERVACAEPGATEWVWRYSNVSVQFRVTERKAGVFGGWVLEILILRLGIRLG
jgi:hypothetical protein